jgi:hypothetical protein
MVTASKLLYPKSGITLPWSRQEVLDSFTDNRKKIYQKAYDSLHLRPLEKRDFTAKCFVKPEKTNPRSKVNPTPRIICARTPRYNMELLRYLRPIEHSIFRKKDIFGHRFIAKGLNQRARADLIREKWALFGDTVAVSLDCSRFDKHVGPDLLRVEHAIYKRYYPGDGYLDMLLDQQLKTRMITFEGVKAEMNHRSTGDPNTGLGNSLLVATMLFIVLTMLQAKGIQFSFICDGDDCVVFCARGDLEVVMAEVLRVFVGAGQELTVEDPVDDIQRVTFCRSRMVNTPSGWRMVRNPYNILSHASCGIRHWNNPRTARGMCTAVGFCLLAENPGVPVIQTFACKLIEFGQGLWLRGVVDIEPGMMYRALYELHVSKFQLKAALKALKPTPVTEMTRQSFANAWDFPIWAQQAYELALVKWVLENTVITRMRQELNSLWQDNSDPKLYMPDVC